MSEQSNLAQATDDSSLDQGEIYYCRLVDATRPTLSGGGMRLDEVYAHFGLPNSMSMSQKCVTEHLYSQIAGAFAPYSQTAKEGVQLKMLKHQLLLRHFADGKQLNPYLALLDVIIDAVRAHYWLAPPLSNEVAWRKALTAAANYSAINPSTFRNHGDHTRQLNQRQYAVAEAIKKLRSFGYTVTIAGGRAEIKHQEQIRIADCIESHLVKAGGVEIAQSIFQFMKKRYDSSQERYYTARRTSTIGRDGGPSSLPVAYLLNLCVKHTAPRTAKGTQAEMAANSAFALATAYAATFDVEPYNTFDTFFHTGSKLPQFLREIAVYDGMFNLAQARPSWVEKSLRCLFGWLDDDIALQSLGWTIDQAALVASSIFKITGGELGPRLFSVDRLAKQIPGLAPSILTSILSAFSHQAGDVNCEYKLPYEQAEVNFWFKPLIEQSQGTYVLMDRSWCAPAFYEATARAVRDRVPNTDSFIGLAFEKLVKDELAAHGVHVVSGEYSLGNQNGQCDAVIETSDRIIFIEMKKKALTRKSRGGSDVDLFTDLSESLLATMCQIGGHEILLFKHGSLELQDDSTTYVIERNGRAVERLALSPVEFGGFQDRGVISQVLKTMTTSTLSAIDVKNAQRISEVQSKGEKLLKQYEELAKLQPDEEWTAFMNCWFLSFGQFLTILQGVSSNDTFQGSLFTTRHITMGSLDFYFEHAQALALKAGHQPQ